MTKNIVSNNIMTKNIEEKVSINVPEKVNSFARSLYGKVHQVFFKYST